MMIRLRSSKNRKISSIERLMFRVNINKETNCWEWSGSKRNGYGRMWDGNRLITSHRFSWMIHFGDIPIGMNVLHACDNPSCVNPEHLFLGTQIDNIMDMCNKGRQVAHKGEKHYKSRLTRKQVNEILFLHDNDGYTYIELASKFNVSKGCINHILNGRSWK